MACNLKPSGTSGWSHSWRPALPLARCLGLAEAAGGEATRSTAQASRPVSFIIQAHFGSMAELLRPCPGQSLPRQGRLKASARGPTESGLIGGLDWGFRLFQRCSGHCRRHVGARNTADCRHSVTV